MDNWKAFTCNGPKMQRIQTGKDTAPAQERLENAQAQ